MLITGFKIIFSDQVYNIINDRAYNIINDGGVYEYY